MPPRCSRGSRAERGCGYFGDARTCGVNGYRDAGTVRISAQTYIWDATKIVAHLDKAIWAHEKGFYVKNDYYNRINLAFLLNVRSALNSAAEPAEAIADFVVAQRIRRRVLALCQALLDSTPAPKGADWYWIQATMAQAYLGLGDEQRAQQLLNEAKAHAGIADWMIQSTEEQLEKLKGLLAQSPLGKMGSIATA